MTFRSLLQSMASKLSGLFAKLWLRKKYDGETDFENSINECYSAVRERVAAGGPAWKPKEDRDDQKVETAVFTESNRETPTQAPAEASCGTEQVEETPEPTAEQSGDVDYEEGYNRAQRRALDPVPWYLVLWYKFRILFKKPNCPYCQLACRPIWGAKCEICDT